MEKRIENIHVGFWKVTGKMEQLFLSSVMSGLKLLLK
jgi:hypothetical protein